MEHGVVLFVKPVMSAVLVFHVAGRGIEPVQLLDEPLADRGCSGVVFAADDVQRVMLVVAGQRLRQVRRADDGDAAGELVDVHAGDIEVGVPAL